MCELWESGARQDGAGDCGTGNGGLFLTRVFAGNEDAAVPHSVSSCRKQPAREVQVRRGLGSCGEPLPGVRGRREARPPPLLGAARRKLPRLRLPFQLSLGTLRVLCFRRRPIFLGWSAAPPIPPATRRSFRVKVDPFPSLAPPRAFRPPGLSDSSQDQPDSPERGLRQGRYRDEAPGPIALDFRGRGLSDRSRTARSTLLSPNERRAGAVRQPRFIQWRR